MQRTNRTRLVSQQHAAAEQRERHARHAGAGAELHRARARQLTPATHRAVACSLCALHANETHVCCAHLVKPGGWRAR
jgi:hypothetical protein